MKDNNRKISESVIWLIFIISTLTFRIIGVGNIPISLYVMYFLILGVLACISLNKHRNEFLGVKYNLLLALSIALSVISLLFTSVASRAFQEVFEKYFTLFGIVTVGSFFLMMGVIIFGGYLKKKQTKK